MIKNNILASIKHSTTPPAPVPVTDAGIYHDAVNGLISFSVDGINWITIADKNLGATVVYNDGDTYNETNCGCFYQRGNNYGFPYAGNVTTDTAQVDASTYGPGNYYSSNVFIVRGYSPYNWDNSGNNDLRGDLTDTYEARRGPCPVGFHIPTADNIATIYDTKTAFNFTGEQVQTYFKMPAAGRRYSGTSNILDQGDYYYWSSSISNSGNPYILSVNNRLYSYNQSNGTSIRPFKNVPVTPDSSRTVLYQPSNDAK